MTYNKIGFHAAVPGNLNGWGDYVRSLDAAGIPAGVMSVGGGGIGDIIGCWEAGSTVPHVVGVRYMPPDGSQDVPPYGSDPRQAAVAWWGWLYPRIGGDVKAHKDKVWIVTGNELNKNQSDWLGRFYVELATIMHGEGFKLCALNFSAGEPEPEHWEMPGMLAYLQLCAARPQDTAVGLHEYSYTIADIFSKKVGDNQFVPMEPGDEYTLVGRFRKLHAVCDARGLRRPTILITEFGWQQETVPDVSTAMAHVAKAAALYAQHPNILWAGIWTLQNWHSGCIPNCVQALITPLRDYTLTAVFPDPQPTGCPGAAREPYNRVYWVAPEANRAAIYALAATERRTVGPSYDDAGIGVGLSGKTAVVWDIAPSQHQQFIDWYALHYPGTAVQFRYLNGGTPAPPVNTPPSPIPCAGGSAREPYNRVYWVVSPDNPHAEEIYAQAVSEARTIGPSYDDAGIGSGLTSKTAVLWDIPANRHAEFVAWYGEHYPGTAVQFRNFAPSPGGQVFYEWPTSYYYVTQPFCVYNPEMYPASLNHRHEGIDVRSPYDTPYRAVAPGRVTWVSDRRQSDGQPSAYGWHVIIDLGWCTTLYAHMRPNPPVMVGQQVLAGQVLGLSGNTGNSTGPHCHLTVKIAGHVDGCGAATNYADPWEWLQPLYDNPPPPPQPHITGWLYTNNGGYLDQKPNGRAVVTSSANMRTSPSSGGTLLRQVQMGEIVIPDGRVQNGYHFVTAAGTGTEPPPSPDYEYNGPAVTFAPMIHAPADEWRWPTVNSMIAGLGIGVKFLSHGVNADFVGQYAGKKRICRLFWNNPAGDSVKTAQQKWNMDWAGDFGRMYNAGIRHFEIHNEPRLASEGFGRQWASAAEWGNWLSQMVDIIKAQYPQAKLYYPGESPGLPWSDQFSFTNVAWPMVRGKMDGFCLHAYSGSSVFNTAVEEIVGQVLEAQAYLNLQVPLIVSESSVNRGVDYWHKANVYVEVEKRLNGVPGIEGVAWFISDWYNPPPDQAGNGESFYGTALPTFYMQLT